MCAIAGVFKPGGISRRDVELIEDFNRIQAHRGPDDTGLYHDRDCALGHRRLAVIDLSRRGRQPFFSEDRRFCMVYNGEIYNYLEIRRHLEKKGGVFFTATDTEVLLKAFILYREKCLSMLNGMFAFAVYDALEKRLFMARDRFGIKPLYYRHDESGFWFASELKALVRSEGYVPEADEDSLFDFLVFGRTDVSDKTFFCGLKRLEKGHYALLDEKGFRKVRWWDPKWFLSKGGTIAWKEAAKRIDDLFISSISLRMRSDVPVGTCLSGGLDSSILIGALYHHIRPETPYKTFTASFPGHRVDETMYVDMLQKKLPFENFRTYPTAKDALENLYRFVYANDEPTASPSFYSQYEVMRLAAENGIVVLLDGQGGDENFAGYQYFHGFNMYGALKKSDIRAFWVEFLLCMIRRQHVSAYQTLVFLGLNDRMKRKLLYSTVGFVKKDFFESRIKRSLIYSRFFSARDLNESIAAHFDYKLEHLLRSEDRNSMSFSIEARVPYLDFRLVEYLLSLPGKMKINRGRTKYLQKVALGKYTEDKIAERRDKLGFATPADVWMKTRAWEKRTQRSINIIADAFPHIISRIDLAKMNAHVRWRINQLAVWTEIFLGR